MRAVVFERPGPLNELRLASLPLPEPKPGEVRVKFLSMGLNRADALFREEKYFIKPAFHPVAGEDSEPLCRVGLEGAGLVDAVGPGVSLKIGERVATLPLRVNPVFQGTFADYGVYAEQDLFVVPASIPEEISGAVWMMYLTAWGGMVADGRLAPGETVTITAASSSVGIAAIQVAKQCGAQVIATSTSEDKRESLVRHGADLVINTREEDYVAKVRDFTGERGTDLVFDAVAGPGMRHLVQGSRRGGRVIVHGMLDRRPMDVHAGVLMKRLLTLKGFTLDQVIDDISLRNDGIRFVSEGLAAGALVPEVAAVYPLAEFANAMALLESNKHTGKIILTP